MMGMTFTSFLTLAVISLIAALVIHYAIGYCVFEGFDGLIGKWIAGWLGAWLALPVLGHWLGGLRISEVFIVPALIGAFVGTFAPAAILRARAMALKPCVIEIHETPKAA
ncbi:MAG TPA: GlsB/YeaQ/YmgE family stress response membrane protein [Terriglobia bacterium]